MYYYDKVIGGYLPIDEEDPKEVSAYVYVKLTYKDLLVYEGQTIEEAVEELDLRDYDDYEIEEVEEI